MGEPNGNKTVSDLIMPDISIEWSDTKGTVTGTIKNIEKYGKPFEEGQDSGHFFPIKFSDEYINRPVIVGSQNGEGGKRIVPTADDQYLVIRVENVTVDKKISAITESTKKEIFELDFSKAQLEQ